MKMKVYRNISLPDILYGCEMLLVTLSGEFRRRVFVYRVVRRVFGAEIDDVKRQWRKLFIGENSDLYIPLHIFRVIKSRKMNWAGHVACMAERKSV
jgi:hypothetical protein